MTRHTFTKALGVLMASLLPVALATPVFAEDTSISIKLQAVEDGDVSTPADGVMTAYQLTDSFVVDGSGNYTFHYQTASFDGATASEIETAIDGGDASLYVSKTDETVGSDGALKISGLPYGVYLISQTTRSTGFDRANPTLVTICDMSNAEYIGDHVIVEPKIEVQTYFPMVVPTGIQMNFPIFLTIFGIFGLFSVGLSKKHPKES